MAFIYHIIIVESNRKVATCALSFSKQAAAALQIACWNYSVMGQQKPNLPNEIVVAAIKLPIQKWNVKNVVIAPQPFVAYYQVLKQSTKEDGGNNVNCPS